MRRYRAVSTFVCAIVVSALVGGFFGRSASAADEKLPDYRTFAAALSAIQANYAGEVEPDTLVYSAIRGMLGTLDPHSSFFDPKAYAQMRERQEGRYYGLGIQIQSNAEGDVVATGVFEGSPAYQSGVRRGDVFAVIGDEDAKGWTTEQAMLKLRGPKGTTVHIEMRRRGYDEPIPLDITRDEVYIPTVPAAFMLDEQTAYLKLQDFGENTDRDLNRLLRELRQRGMRRLVLDIRGNPGGPLDQAIKVTNEFLPKGKMIVYTRGRVRNSDQDYRATEDGEFTGLPIVVLTNRSSASAAEIVSGALQDHDRAVVVGETTFGKALVQSVYRISGGAGLALTTAHYYTPSGRLIQRPWDPGFDEYQLYTLQDQGEERTHSPTELKYTEAGRPVYSGGGIEPDARVAGPVGPGTTGGFNVGRFARTLNARQVFANYAQKYSAEGDDRVELQSTGRMTVSRNFVVDDEMLADFRQQLVSDNITIDEEEFEKDVDFIKAMIRFEIDVALFGVADAWRHLIQVDPQARAGLAQFGEAERLLTLNASGSKVEGAVR
jgi:carboxyl-terminal processing protease